MGTVDANRVILTGENSVFGSAITTAIASRRMLPFGVSCRPQAGRAMFSI
jgi:hypothetical protein